MEEYEYHWDWNDIRGNVAENPNTPIDILTTLSKDENEDVRGSVAKNPNTPIDILQELSNDKNNKVRQFALKNMEKLNDPSYQSTQNEQAELVRKLFEDKMISNTITLDSLLKEKGYDRDSGIGKELVKLYNDTQDKLNKELEGLKSQVIDIATNDFNER